MNRIVLLIACLTTFGGLAQPTKGVRTEKATSAWPETMPWWKANNLRVIQLNLPDYEATLNVDSLVADMQYFSANTLIINAGGIMAFYPSKLPFHYINPYMKQTCWVM